MSSKPKCSGQACLAITDTNIFADHGRPLQCTSAVIRCSHTLSMCVIFLLVILLVSSNAFGATESKKIIRENGTGDYTSLAAWQEAEWRDLVASDEIAVAEIDGSWASPDTGPIVISNWTTDANHYVRIYTTPAARHSGIWDDTKYRIVADCHGEHALYINVEARVDGLQVSFTGSDDPPAGNNFSAGIGIGRAIPLSGEVRVSNNIIKRTGAAHASRESGIVSAKSGILKIWNNIIYDIAGGPVQSRGIYFSEGGASLYIYNNTVYNSGYGIRLNADRGDGIDGGAMMLLKNNLCFDNTLGDYNYYFRGFDGASENNISGDDSSPNAGFRNKTVAVNNLSGRDLHLTAQATDAIDSGVDLSGDSYISFNTDIDGNTRPSGAGWDIGADEAEQGPILVGHWKFDEGSGTTANDSSGNGNTGTLINNPAWTTGKFNGALNFDGTAGVVDVGSGSTLDDIPAITISAWIKPDSVGGIGGEPYGRIYAKSYVDAGVISFCIGEMSGYTAPCLIFQRRWTASEGNWITNSQSITYGEWQHVAVTYDNNSASNDAVLYINGVSQTNRLSLPNTGDTLLTDAPCNGMIGNVLSGTRTFDGGIDDVRIYNKILSPSEILALYNGGGDTNDNLALGKAAVASSLEDTAYAAGNAVDGNTGTRWSSLETEIEWIYVDLGSTYNVDRVVLKWEAAYGRSYEIQISANATDWTQAYTTTSGDGGTDDISFSTVSARYVRMYGTQRGTPYCYSLWEFEVYGNTGTQDTTSPTTPSSVRDGTGTDISSTLVTNQLSANWDASIDVESGISNYQYAIGTTAGGTQTLGWTTLGNVTAVTKTGLSLIIGTTYYFNVKAINGVGLTSTAANSNGQVLISTATALDTTAPVGPSIVRDGAVVGSDDSYTYSTTALSANWPAATDAQSGISGYEYAIGTTAGGTQALTWTAIGNLTAVTKTGLSLTTGTTYYFSIRAINGQGLTGTAVNSNGQYVKAVIPGDTTPPADISAIRDGLYLNMDISKTDTTAELSANWNATIDAESGVDKYWYAIGTTVGGSNVATWTDNGQLTGVTHTGLSLGIGTTYYFSVKAENSLGLQSSVTNSNGQYISDELPPPVIEIEITNIQIVTTANSVTITWVTNVPATSQVEYWTNPANKKLTIKDTSLGTSHSVVLTGLTGNTQYQYRVISGDSGGDTTTSSDLTFATLSTLNEVTDSSAYPNPCDFKGGRQMSFNIIGGGEAGIYTIRGKLVKKLRADSGTGSANWDGTNEAGEKVTRGIYIYKIKAANGSTTTGKVAVTR